MLYCNRNLQWLVVFYLDSYLGLILILAWMYSTSELDELFLILISIKGFKLKRDYNHTGTTQQEGWPHTTGHQWLAQGSQVLGVVVLFPQDRASLTIALACFIIYLQKTRLPGGGFYHHLFGTGSLQQMALNSCHHDRCDKRKERTLAITNRHFEKWRWPLSSQSSLLPPGTHPHWLHQSRNGDGYQKAPSGEQCASNHWPLHVVCSVPHHHRVITARVLYDQFISIFSAPETILSNHGANFPELYHPDALWHVWDQKGEDYPLPCPMQWPSGTLSSDPDEDGG